MTMKDENKLQVHFFALLQIVSYEQSVENYLCLGYHGQHPASTRMFPIQGFKLGRKQNESIQALFT